MANSLHKRSGLAVRRDAVEWLLIGILVAITLIQCALFCWNLNQTIERHSGAWSHVGR